ncbi:MAG: MerR family transcriptional regulator [Clostridiales bacterium]|jgi:DNA-binding transcriptional MerR regulator|nr:MerR family transcriptional regulator [Clostridiales bacterium]
MTYSISQVARKTNLTPYTLRYYDQEGILSTHRTEGGVRYFTEEDLEQLGMVCCLKSTGMTVKEIKKYFDLCREGDETLERRMEIFTTHRQHILDAIAALQKNLCRIEEKIAWYQSCMDAPSPPESISRHPGK